MMECIATREDVLYKLSDSFECIILSVSDYTKNMWGSRIPSES